MRPIALQVVMSAHGATESRRRDAVVERSVGLWGSTTRSSRGSMRVGCRSLGVLSVNCEWPWDMLDLSIITAHTRNKY